MGSFFNRESFKRMLSRKKTVCVNNDEKRRHFLLMTDSDQEQENTPVFDTEPTAGRIVMTVVLLLLAIFIQEGLFNGIRFISVKPAVFLAALMCVACCADVKFSLISGVSGGLLLDVCYGRFFGFYALIYMYFAVIVSVLVNRRIKGKPFVFFLWSPVVLFVFGVIESVFSRLLLIYNAKTNVLFDNFLLHLGRRVLPWSLYTGLLFAVLVFPVTMLWSRLGRRRVVNRKMFR